jgi:hypothetical protein
MRETDLYQPIKRFLEQQGYEVKAEIGSADVVAVRGNEPPLIVETKTGFSLSLFHQGTERQAITDLVYIAVPLGRGQVARRALQRNLKLCRLLGLGLLTIGTRDPQVQVHADPVPYRPRQSKTKKTRLLGEFVRRVGDPNLGGATRKGLVTAYRQEATRCAQFLTANGATKAALVAKGCGVPHARRIMADNHYGWFQRLGSGIYGLTPEYNQKLDDRAGNRPAG